MIRKEIDIIETNHGKIEYSRKGNGSPILYLHGSLSNCNDDFGHEPLIKAGFSIISPSRPGYGHTPLSSGQTAEQAADLLQDLLDYLNIKVIDVIAVSGGGLTGLYFCSKYQNSVRKIILESAVSKPLNLEKERYKSAKLFYGNRHRFIWWTLNVMGTFSKRSLVKKTYELFSTCNVKTIMKEITDPEIDAVVKFYKKDPENIGALNDLDHFITDDVICNILAPTLIVHSRQDRAVPFEHAENANKLICNSELFIADTWGHFIWIGNGSEQVSQKVISFLK